MNNRNDKRLNCRGWYGRDGKRYRRIYIVEDGEPTNLIQRGEDGRYVEHYRHPLTVVFRQRGWRMSFPPGLDDLRRPTVVEDDSDRSWLILYDEDYHDFMLDGEDNLYVLVDDEQAEEVERLAAKARDPAKAGDGGGDR